MSAIRTFRDLRAWQVAMDVVELTYRLTALFPPDERFGQRMQMRRAAVSIPSNVAEGQGVRASRWSLRYIVVAIGSACELETQLEAAVRLKFVTADAAANLSEQLDRTQKLLYGMRREKELRLGTAMILAVSVVLAVVHAVL